MVKGDFRQGVKTQGSLPKSEAGHKLLFGLFASGQIVMRRIGGLRGPARRHAPAGGREILILLFRSDLRVKAE